MTKLFFFIIFLSFFFIGRMNAQEQFFPPDQLVTTGTYYYPEHWDPGQWERDFKKMASMGFEFTHFAEFAWAMLEPQEDVYDFEWLDRAVELAKKHDLKIIMCTSTATPPVWLSRKYPEILRVKENGQIIDHGKRQHASFSSEVFRKHSLEMIAALADHYADEEAIIGWQLDNEPKGTFDYSENAEKRFRQWLKQKYQSIDSLNQAWGTAFWSMTYQDFDQIALPKKSVGMNNPHQILDHKRFMARETAQFLSLQADTIRKYIDDKQWVTTNFQNDIASVDPWLNQDLDFISHTTYMVHGYNKGVGERGFRRGNPVALAYAGEYYRSINGYTGIMELQPGQVNWGQWSNPLPQPGAVRMWLWHAYATGSEFVCTYRFRQPLYGSEQYHYGIVGTDGVTPSYGGIEFQQFMNEINDLRRFYQPERAIDDHYPKRRTGFMVNRDNRWEMQNQPRSRQWNYMGHLKNKYYKNLKSFGVPVDFLEEADSLQQYRVVIAPAYQLLDLHLLEKWKNYVKNGGHLVLTCRTGQKDKNAHLWEDKWVAPIAKWLNVEFMAYDLIPEDEHGTVRYKGKEYKWNNWGDIINPLKESEVLATYQNDFYAGKAAVVKKEFGEGHVTYIGIDTDDGQLEKEILKNVYKNEKIDLMDLPEGIMIEYRDGFGIAVNYSDQKYELPVSKHARFFIGNRVLKSTDVAVWHH